MDYYPGTIFPNSSTLIPEGPPTRDPRYSQYRSTSISPPMMPLTALEHSMLPGNFYGQFPPRYTTTNAPLMADAFLYKPEAYSPRSQVPIPRPVSKEASPQKTVPPKPALCRAKKQTKYVIHIIQAPPWPKHFTNASPSTSSLRPTPSILICKWSNCNKPFARKQSLVRHVVTQHVDPGSVPCLDEECKNVFNRKDNMMSHFRSVHGDA